MEDCPPGSLNPPRPIRRLCTNTLQGMGHLIGQGYISTLAQENLDAGNILPDYPTLEDGMEEGGTGLRRFPLIYCLPDEKFLLLECLTNS